MNLRDGMKRIRQTTGRFLKELTMWLVWTVIGASLIFVVLLVGWVIFGALVASILFFLGLMVLVVGLFLFAYFYLANRNYWFTFAKEGKANIVVKGDAFSKALIQWGGFTLDDDQNVVPENQWALDGKTKVNGGAVAENTPGAKKYKETWHPFGGFRYYGFWPIKDILVHTLRWHDIQRTEKGMEPQFHEKKDMDYVLLQPDIYWTKETDVETGYVREGQMERIAVTVEWLVTMRVVNPKKALFRAPVGYIENSLLKLSPLLRAIVTAKDLDSLFLLKGRGEDIWKDLETRNEIQLINDLENDWGLKVEENGIQIWKITPPPEIQRAAARQREQEFESKGRAAKTAGMVIDMFCAQLGAKKGEVQSEFKRNPEAFIRRHETVWEKCWDIAQRQMGIEANAYQDLRTSNALTDIAVILSGGIPRSQKNRPKRDEGGKGEKKEKKGKEEEESEED